MVNSLCGKGNSVKNVGVSGSKSFLVGSCAARPRNAALDDLLEDPIVHLVMRRDGIDEDTVRRFVRDSAKRLRRP